MRRDPQRDTITLHRVPVSPDGGRFGQAKVGEKPPRRRIASAVRAAASGRGRQRCGLRDLSLKSRFVCRAFSRAPDREVCPPGPTDSGIFPLWWLAGARADVPAPAIVVLLGKTLLVGTAARGQRLSGTAARPREPGLPARTHEPQATDGIMYSRFQCPAMPSVRHHVALSKQPSVPSGDCERKNRCLVPWSATPVPPRHAFPRGTRAHFGFPRAPVGVIFPRLYRACQPTPGSRCARRVEMPRLRDQPRAARSRAKGFSAVGGASSTPPVALPRDSRRPRPGLPRPRWLYPFVRDPSRRTGATRGGCSTRASG